MSAATKKPFSGAPNGQKSVKDTTSSPQRNSIRSTPAPSSVTIGNGIGRRRSIRSPAPVTTRSTTAQRAVAGSVNNNHEIANNEVDDEERGASLALVDDLKERLRKAEEISDQFRKQTQVLQSRLDDALKEQGILEERLHESVERVEALENEKRDAIRQKREMESIYEAERCSLTKEREESSNREEEMQIIIQRLKDSLNSRVNGDEEIRSTRRSIATSPKLENGQFAPSSGLNRSDSQNNSKLLLQKDRLIEALRLELAESQIKLVEAENIGGGRFHDIERKLLEARMVNAKLMEDNESYQLLLSEKTLTGDFSKSEFMGSALHNADALSALEGRTEAVSLADELSEAEGGENSNHKTLEAELKSSKEQNKALTLYINKIIERLLQHQDFEAILDQSSDLQPTASNLDKELPNPPKEASGASVLQRAKTVAMGATRRPRPHSFMPLLSQSVVTDQGTAPSIPLSVNRSSSYRGNRPASEQFTGSAANVVNQMYRGGHASPPFHGPQTPRNNQSFFSHPPAMGNPNAAHRIPNTGQGPTSGNFPGMKSETSSVSGESGEVSTPPSNSPPRTEKATTLAGNKPRPLRLVQGSGPEEEASAKVSNKRTSWMGWAFGKKEETHIGETVKE